MSTPYAVALTFILLVANTQAVSLPFSGLVPPIVTDVAKGVISVGQGLADEVMTLFPTPVELFESNKNLVAGYPFAMAFSAINDMCASLVAADAVIPRITPDPEKMNFQLRTASSNQSYPILKVNEILNNPEFDPTKKVVIMITGWTTTIENNGVLDVLAKAFSCRGDVNFVAVDVANFVDTLYTWSALNTDGIGAYLAESVMQLCNFVPVENIHLVGHSLGAHIAGATARYFSYKTGKLVPRITGLDPAKPCFKEGQVLSGLMRGDAEFIDVIHSDPGALGIREPLGDVDFYPGGVDPLPPGCLDISCAHGRAVSYFEESVYPSNAQNFMAKRCNSLTSLRQGKCPGVEYPMGYAVPTNLKGSYFSEVNGQSPFGKNGNANNMKALESCGKCA